MTKRRTSDELYGAARTARDLEAIASGNPQRIARRVKNRILGHFIFRALRQLWR